MRQGVKRTGDALTSIARNARTTGATSWKANGVLQGLRTSATGKDVHRVAPRVHQPDRRADERMSTVMRGDTIQVCSTCDDTAVDRADDPTMPPSASLCDSCLAIQAEMNAA